MEVIEVPAFRNRMVAQDITQGHGVCILLFWKISDPSQLKGRPEGLITRFCICGLQRYRFRGRITGLSWSGLYGNPPLPGRTDRVAQ